MSGASSGSEAPAEAWFRRWFGEEYLRLYPHRDQEEADQGVRLLLAQVPVDREARVLDLACGAGRHLRSLTRQGLRPVGLDLSPELLRSAREHGSQGPLVRGDMRHLPFADGAFGMVTSFFTSFGYFRTESDDVHVLSEIARILRPGGHLLLDFLNAERVRRTLRPRDEEELEGRRVVQERRLVERGRTVEKTIRIETPDGAEPEIFHERVRLYTPEQLGTLLTGRGFQPLSWFGDYGGASPAASSPRTIVIARGPTSTDPSA